jgi:hypothetical protein
MALSVNVVFSGRIHLQESINGNTSVANHNSSKDDEFAYVSTNLSTCHRSISITMRMLLHHIADALCFTMSSPPPGEPHAGCERSAKSMFLFCRLWCGRCPAGKAAVVVRLLRQLPMMKKYPSMGMPEKRVCPPNDDVKFCFVREPGLQCAGLRWLFSWRTPLFLGVRPPLRLPLVMRSPGAQQLHGFQPTHGLPCVLRYPSMATAQLHWRSSLLSQIIASTAVAALIRHIYLALPDIPVIVWN